jgi:hypothetical protein
MLVGHSMLGSVFKEAVWRIAGHSMRAANDDDDDTVVHGINQLVKLYHASVDRYEYRRLTEDLTRLKKRASR